MPASRLNLLLALVALGFGSSSLACATGNYVPQSGINGLYYVDTGSTSKLVISTYFFDADCTQQLTPVLRGPDGTDVPCDTMTEPGIGFADITCKPMNSFTDGQHTLLMYGNVFQYNEFRVTTSQQTNTVTPTVTITQTPIFIQTIITTLTDLATATYTPPAVTSPASVGTVTVTPPKVTQWATQTWTKTRLSFKYTAVPTVVKVSPKCKIEKPPSCKPLPPKYPFAIRRVEEASAAIEERSNDLVKRAGVSTLQPPVTTVTKSTDLPTYVATTTTSTVTDLDIHYATITATETLPVPTVYDGVSIATITKVPKTKTRTKHTVSTLYITKTKTHTYTIRSTTSPSPAEITKCRKAGGHYF